MQEFEFELDVLITGQPIPLEGLSYELQKKIVKDLIKIIDSNLRNSHGGEFSFEIVRISSGCIKCIIKVTWKITKDLLEVTKNILIIYGLATSLNLGDVYGEYECEDWKCRAVIRNIDSIKEKHTVKNGETLSSIAMKYDRGENTQEQIMVAIFNANPQAFINGDRNRIKAGVALTIP